MPVSFNKVANCEKTWLANGHLIRTRTQRKCRSSSIQHPLSTIPSRLRVQTGRLLIKISACPAEFRRKFLHASGGQLKSCCVNTHCLQSPPMIVGHFVRNFITQGIQELISICEAGTLRMWTRNPNPRFGQQIAIPSSDIPTTKDQWWSLLLTSYICNLKYSICIYKYHFKNIY